MSGPNLRWSLVLFLLHVQLLLRVNPTSPPLVKESTLGLTTLGDEINVYAGQAKSTIPLLIRLPLYSMTEVDNLKRNVRVYLESLSEHQAVKSEEKHVLVESDRLFPKIMKNFGKILDSIEDLKVYVVSMSAYQDMTNVVDLPDKCLLELDTPSFSDLKEYFKAQHSQYAAFAARYSTVLDATVQIGGDDYDNYYFELRTIAKDWKTRTHTNLDKLRTFKHYIDDVLMTAESLMADQIPYAVLAEAERVKDGNDYCFKIGSKARHLIKSCEKTNLGYYCLLEEAASTFSDVYYLVEPVPYFRDGYVWRVDLPAHYASQSGLSTVISLETCEKEGKEYYCKQGLKPVIDECYEATLSNSSRIGEFCKFKPSPYENQPYIKEVKNGIIIAQQSDAPLSLIVGDDPVQENPVLVESSEPIKIAHGLNRDVVQGSDVSVNKVQTPFLSAAQQAELFVVRDDDESLIPEDAEDYVLLTVSGIIILMLLVIFLVLLQRSRASIPSSWFKRKEGGALQRSRRTSKPLTDEPAAPPYEDEDSSAQSSEGEILEMVPLPTLGRTRAVKVVPLKRRSEAGNLLFKVTRKRK